jgi:hypothetical protein
MPFGTLRVISTDRLWMMLCIGAHGSCVEVVKVPHYSVVRDREELDATTRRKTEREREWGCSGTDILPTEREEERQ